MDGGDGVDGCDGLLVDGPDPSFVILTTTGNRPLVNDWSATTMDGVTLLGFWNLPTAGGSSMMGSLTPHGAAFKWQVVPEPSALAFARIALTAVALLQSRRKRTEV